MLNRKDSAWPCISPLAGLTIAALVVHLSLAASAPVWHRANNLSNTPGQSIHTTVARDPVSGDLFVAWSDKGIATWEEILLRRWDQDTGVWLAAENLSQSQPWARDGGPVLFFDSLGRGLLVWTRTYSVSQGAPASGHDVLWRAWDGASWSVEQVLFHGDSYIPGSPGTYGLALVEVQGDPTIFILWGTGYQTAKYQGGSWTLLSPWVYLDVRLAKIVAGPGGVLHAAAFGENSLQWDYNALFEDAYYLTYDGSQWSVPLNLSSYDGVARDIGLAFDSQGRLHLLWSDPDSAFSDESLKSAIWERVLVGGIWTPSTEVTEYNTAQAIDTFSLSAGDGGTLHLAWSEGLMVNNTHTGLDIYYQAGDGTAWGTETRVYTSTAASRYPLTGQVASGAFVVWEEVFDAGGSIDDHEVYFSRQIGEPAHLYHAFLPLVPK